MFRIIDKYLLRELFGAFFTATLVMMLITVGGTLTLTLDRIARGRIPPNLLFSQIGLRSLDALTIVLPLALFLGALLAFGRLYRDSEMAVLSASGVSVSNLLRPLAWLAVPLISLLFVIAFWLGPAALRISDRMVEAANRSLLVAGLEPGRFINLPGRDAVIYVGEMDNDGTHFRRLFVHDEKNGREDIVTAARGELYLDRGGEERYLRLFDGYRVEGEEGKPGYRVLHFTQNDIRLPEPDAGEDKRPQKRLSSQQLANSSERVDRAELHWRLAFPLSALVLALLAVPLARSSPRDPRYGMLLVAVLTYVVYFNCLSLGRAWLADGKLPMVIGLWWVHVPALILAFAMLVRQGAFVAAPPFPPIEGQA